MSQEKERPLPTAIGQTAQNELNKVSVSHHRLLRNTDPLSAESNELMKPDKTRRYQMILNVMNGEMTAREICDALGYHEMNMVRPRITELIKQGIVEKCGTTFDSITQRTVNVFRITEDFDHARAV